MNELPSLTLTLETVTPLFLGGADNRTPELRPPPFRGLMRYWFRALVGGVLGDGDDALKVLRKAEAQVFGSPDDKHGQSAVWVRLSTPSYDRNYRTRVLPHRGDTWTNHQRRTLKNYPQSAIPPGVTPTLILTLKPKADIQNLELAVWSLMVGLALGGVGKRSRRGFGSLRIQTIQGFLGELDNTLQQQLTQASHPPADGEELAQQIGKLLTAARNAFSGFLNNPTLRFAQDPPQFPVIRPDTHIVIWTPDKPLKDHTAALSPLMNKLSSLMRHVGQSDFAQAFGGIKPRRASPLWVSAHRLQNDGLALVLTHLMAQYCPDRPGNQHHLVTNFLNTPPSGWMKTEVAP